MKISPEAYFKRAAKYTKAPKDMSGWTHLVTNYAVEASTLVYLDDKNERFLVLTLVKQGDGWKTHVVRTLSKHQIPGAAKLLVKEDYSFLKRDPFLPPKSMPPTPVRVAADYLGFLTLTSIGYTSTISINGHTCGSPSNSTLSSRIIGGLNSGDNSVALKVKAIDSPARREFKLLILARTSQKGPQKVVFTLDEPKSLEQKFVINNALFD